MKRVSNCKILLITRQFLPSMISLGRSPNCEVVINDNMLSRFHCYIEYKYGVGWIIMDGVATKNEKSIVENKNSTNGTW